jgi:hypothetical protein
MRDREPPTQRPFLPVDPVVQEQIRDTYSDRFIESSLRAYAQGASDEREASGALEQFSVYLAGRATRENFIDTDIVRFGVEHVADSMDKICREILTPQPRYPKWRGLLAKVGLVGPPRYGELTYMHRLDDKYWESQFLKEYEENSPFVKRQPQETDQKYLERYINHVIQGFLFAPFSHIR